MDLSESKKAFLCFILTGFFLITGCSSSSDSIRYGSGNDDKEEKEEPVRYGKNERKEPDKITTSENEAEDSDGVPDDLTSVDISVLEKQYRSMEGNRTEAATLKENMLMEIIRYMNTPYKYGGSSKEGIDCSAFTQAIFGSCSISLLRSAKEQFTQGVSVGNKGELKFGDLVFFNTRKIVRPGHVGIYIGDNLFVHASSKHGVIVTPLTHDYYSNRYMGARRIDQSLGF